MTPRSDQADHIPAAAEPVSAAGDVISYRQADPERRARIERAIREIDLGDANSILFFGNKAQEKLTIVSDTMLEGVRNKDVGPAGAALSQMLSTLRGFNVADLDPDKERRLLSRLFGVGKPIAKVLQRYEEVRLQIDRIGDRLDAHKSELLGDIIALDRLYDANLEYFHHLADYIAAGGEKLRELDEEILPKLQHAAETSGDVLKVQQLRDMRGVRDDLERRVHDLKLTRQVAMQSLPSIRLVQQNDKSLVGWPTLCRYGAHSSRRRSRSTARAKPAGRSRRRPTSPTNCSWPTPKTSSRRTWKCAAK